MGKDRKNCWIFAVLWMYPARRNSQTLPCLFLPVTKAISLSQEASGSMTTVLTECQDQHGHGHLWSSPLGKL